MSGLVLAYLWFNRNTEVEGTNLSYPTVVLPSMLGALLVFSLIIGPAYALAMGAGRDVAPGQGHPARRGRPRDGACDPQHPEHPAPPS